MVEPLSIVDYLAARRELVIEEIRATIPKNRRHTAGLYDLMLDYPLRPGKAIRPALSIAVCRGAGGSMSAIIPTAAALELYHNAFLVHDDVEDRSEKRRHEPTLNRLHGMPTAVNVGDGMLALAIRPLLDNVATIGLGKALTILRVIARMARETAEGQMLELDWIQSGRWTQTDMDYIRLVYKKTAWYSFVAPLMIGAVAAGLRDQAMLFGRAGIPLGIAFQIQDDILNLETESKSYGKDYCADLWEGKHTLILIHALRCANRRRRAEAMRILRKPQPAAAGTPHRAAAARRDKKLRAEVRTLAARGAITRDAARVLLRVVDGERSEARQASAKTFAEVGFIRDLIDRHESIPYARGVARRHAEKFRRSLELLAGPWPRSEHRDFLFALGDFTISRTD
jgi:geranylgeranyl diphosphate synthase type II